MGRFEKSIKNAGAGFFFYALNLLLTFFSRKYFIEILGSELLGLNSVSLSLLSFLNIAEMGIATAASFSLYGPLFQNDKAKVIEIISIQGYLYKRIALFIMGASLILMLFFPFFFRKIDLPIIYAYASFIALSVGVLLGYWVNYRQIIFQADQRSYISTYVVHGGRAFKTLLQIGSLLCFDPAYSYWIWLGLEVFVAILQSCTLEFLIDKFYPYLQTNRSLGKLYHKTNKQLIKATRQVFFHKLGGFALQQASPLIIYALANLSLVAVFENYNLIFVGVTMLMFNIFNGVIPSIGNFIEEVSKKEVVRLYWELFALRSCLVCCILTLMYFLIPPFVRLWVGESFTLPDSTIFLMIMIYYIRMFRESTDSFISAYGLFQDIWAPIVESILNIGLSLLLGYFWGLNGILLGIFISLFLIIYLWKPIFLFKKQFQLSPLVYFQKNSLHLAVSIGFLCLMVWLNSFIPLTPSASIAQFSLYTLLLSVLIVGIGGTVFYLLFPDFRYCLKRVSAKLKRH